MRGLLAFALPLLAHGQQPTSGLSTYSARISAEFARLAGAMSCGDSAHGGTDGLTGWTWPPLGDGGVNAPQPRGEGPEEYVTPVENATAGTFGAVIHVAREAEQGQHIILVTLRATIVPENCRANDDERLVPYPPNEELQVHSGFYNAYLSLRPQIMRAIQAIARDHRPTIFALTGWSLGGAMMTYLAMDLRREGFEQPITAYGYGAGRTGDQAFADAFAALPGINGVNVWHRGDAVPECGLFQPNGDAGCSQYARGFRHGLSTIAWYPAGLADANSGEGYVLCPSNAREGGCGPSAADLNFDDHLFYMGEGMFCCNPAGGDRPLLAPSEGGPPVPETISQQCRAPFGSPGCNPNNLHEPDNARARAAKGAAHDVLQPHHA